MSGNLKNKMLNHEQTPPKSVWDSIAKKLDEEEENIPGLAKKLENFEAIPPLTTWAAINDELDKEEQATQTGTNKKSGKIIYWRIASAAAVALIISTVIWNLKTTTIDKPVVAINVPVKKQESSSTVSTVNKNDIVINDTIIKNKLPLIPKDKQLITKEEIVFDPNDVADNYVKLNDVKQLTKDPFENNVEKLMNSDGNYAINTDLINAPNRYVIIAGPDGNSRRVSTKLSAYIGYLNDKTPDGEEAIDVIIRESAIWKNRLMEWSNKLINKAISPTPSNFMDVIELCNLLSEKK